MTATDGSDISLGFRWTAEKGFEAIATMHHMTDLKTGMDLLDIFGQHAEKAVY